VPLADIPEVIEADSGVGIGLYVTRWTGKSAKLAVRGRGQAGASKTPGLRSAMPRRTIMIADCRSLHLTLSDSSSADLY
jgi:hypothetical protein